MDQAWRLAKKIFRIIFLSLGFFSFILIIFSFTRIPFDFHRWLGTSDSEYSFPPECIVFLGGSGMPSESNLIRLYYTSDLAQEFPKAKIIIVHPLDSEVIQLMRQELILQQVDSARIEIESKGTSTREQAMIMVEDFPDLLSKNIVLVTSPENMRRSVKTFRKAGFKSVGGEPAFESAMFVDLSYDNAKVGRKKYAPDVSSNLALRYNFWNYLKLEITCLRELTALAYYKLNGWI